LVFDEEQRLLRLSRIVLERCLSAVDTETAV